MHFGRGLLLVRDYSVLRLLCAGNRDCSRLHRRWMVITLGEHTGTLWKQQWSGALVHIIGLIPTLEIRPASKMFNGIFHSQDGPSDQQAGRLRAERRRAGFSRRLLRIGAH